MVADCPVTAGCLFDALPAWAPDGRLSFLRFYGPCAARADCTTVSSTRRASTCWPFRPAVGGHDDPALELCGPAVGRRAALVARRPSRRRRAGQLRAPHQAHGARHGAVRPGRDGGAQRRITPWELGAASPDWSPDGSRIAFASAGGHSPSLYVVRADGSGRQKVLQGDTRSTVGLIQQPAWSPDGRRIAFAAQPQLSSSHRISQLDLFSIDADGSRLRAITRTSAYESAPAWAPG